MQGVEPESVSLSERICGLLAGGDREGLDDLFDEVHISTVAEEVELLEEEEQRALLSMAGPSWRAHLFSYLPEALQLRLSDGFSTEELADLVAHLSHDERVDFLALLEEEDEDEEGEGRRSAILALLERSEQVDIERLGGYDEGTIGALMTSDFVSLRPDVTALEAIGHLREKAADAETIYYTYVLDAESRLVGVVSLRELILAAPEEKVEEFMTRDVISLHTRWPVEEAVKELQRSDLLALPVYDRQDKMVGIVTYDDVQDVAEEESTEDFLRLGGSGGLEGTSLNEAGLLLLVRKRLPWLLVLVFVNILSGAGIAAFEETISRVVALVFFLPLLIGSGGNAGSQSATLVVRSLATGDVGARDWLRLLGKELVVAVLLGLCMAAAVFFIGAFRGGYVVALVVSLSMVCTVLVGSLMGLSLPFLLERFKMDPATASTPLVTSICDICGVLIYFGIATAIFRALDAWPL
jgi:magnesium transporter